MDNNCVNQEMNNIEAEKNQPDNIYAQILKRMTASDEYLQNALNEIIMMRVELLQASLNDSKNEQEIQQTLIELDALDKDIKVSNEKMLLYQDLQNSDYLEVESQLEVKDVMKK